MEQLKIKPSSEGLIVRDPKSQVPLSKDGEIKPMRGKDGTYWRRRLIDGSVIVVKEQAEVKSVETGTDQKKNKFFGGTKK